MLKVSCFKCHAECHPDCQDQWDIVRSHTGLESSQDQEKFGGEWWVADQNERKIQFFGVVQPQTKMKNQLNKCAN